MEYGQVTKGVELAPQFVRVGGRFGVECIKPDGSVRWYEDAKNLVPNVMLQHIEDVTFAGATQSATWYTGLIEGAPTVASGDTLASHGGWTESSDYTGDRQEYVDVRTNQTISNAASVAAFPITTTVSIGGAFLADVATGTTGILGCAAAFTASTRSALNGDTINVTYTFTAADA